MPIERRSSEPPDNSLDVVEDSPFYIPSPGPSARPRRVLKHADTFAVFDSYGDIGVSAGGQDGLFDHDTRYLSHLELLVAGMQPLLLGSGVRDDNLALTADLTNPDIFFEGHIVLPRDMIHIVRSAYLWNAAAHQRIALSNHSSEVITLALSLSFASDFADLFEVRGQRRVRRGELREEVPSATDVTYAYEGLDGVVRRTELNLDPTPTQLFASAAVYRLKLEPRGVRSPWQ
jgi:glycogen debranching enzyme